MAMSDHHAARAQDGSAVSVLDPAAAYNHDIFNIVALPMHRILKHKAFIYSIATTPRRMSTCRH